MSFVDRNALKSDSEKLRSFSWPIVIVLTVFFFPAVFFYLGRRGVWSKRLSYSLGVILLLSVTVGAVVGIRSVTTNSLAPQPQSANNDWSNPENLGRPTRAQKAARHRVGLALQGMTTAKAYILDINELALNIVAEVPGGGASELPGGGFGFTPNAMPDDFDRHAKQIFTSVYGIARYYGSEEAVVAFGRVEDKTTGRKYEINVATYTLRSSKARQIDWGSTRGQNGINNVKWSKYRDFLEPALTRPKQK